MKDRFINLLNRLDINKDGKVDIQDVADAWDFLDAEVKPHGWMWTVSMVFLGLLLGYGLKACT